MYLLGILALSNYLCAVAHMRYYIIKEYGMLNKLSANDKIDRKLENVLKTKVKDSYQSSSRTEYKNMAKISSQ